MSFFTNIYKKNASMRNLCSDVASNIQTCIGCDETCFLYCTEYCADDCMAGASDVDPGCYDCYGNCVDATSIFTGK